MNYLSPHKFFHRTFSPCFLALNRCNIIFEGADIETYIPLWTENNPDIKEILLPTAKTDWSSLNSEEKKRIWKFLEEYLFVPVSGSSGIHDFLNFSCSYKFFGKNYSENENKAKIVGRTIVLLNHIYKKQSYGRKALEENTYDAACSDFFNIFINQERDVVFEMLSIYSNCIVEKAVENISKRDEEDDNDFEKRKEIEIWTKFDEFSAAFNNVFDGFGINYKLTRAGIIPIDEPVVIEKIYSPALKKLSNKKWAPVNRDLRDAFQALTNDKHGSGALTNATSALQGFLQILITGKIGKGDIGKLIAEGIKNKIIPDDDFSKVIIKDLESFWAKERQAKGDPHPKKEYATKEQAKLIISLVVVFIDHVL